MTELTAGPSAEPATEPTVQPAAVPTTTFTVSLVVDAAVTRLEALDAIAAAVGTSLVDPGTSYTTVPLSGGAWATVDIPKFGEAPPLAIDISDERSAAEAQAAADGLLPVLAAATGWSISRLY
jgi:hypothetical protein